MKLSRPTVAQVALIAASMLAFIAGGHFVVSSLIDSQLTKQLQELTDVALRRSESAIDYGAQTLDQIAKRGPMNCDAAALQTVRLQVYQRGAIKDIRVVNHDGSIVCSAYSETLEFDSGWVDRSEMQPTDDGRLLLFRVDQFNGLALGLLKDEDENRALVAVLGINSYLLDIMPAELRKYSEVVLELSNGLQVGRFPSATGEGLISRSLKFSRASGRYPLRATIRIEASAFNRWDREPYFPVLILATILGLAFGLLWTRTLAHAESPLAELDRGIALNEFKPFFQPIFNLRTGAIVGCEVLARWIRSDGTVISPLSFIPLAEGTGRIEPMTWQILSIALLELKPRLRKDKYFRLSLNVVPHHLVGPGFVEMLRHLVVKARVSPRQVVVEVTERQELPDLVKAAAVIKELRDIGFKVAIDDVGTGHSGLSQIQCLGANTIKIDKFFIDTITRDTTAVTIVKMLVRLAQEMTMTVVAEGIETADQISALVACGVDEGQGYIVSPPLPIAKFNKLLETSVGVCGATRASGQTPLVA